ncbi:hypothetical protein RF11_05541 [Thelohanellus kitauei]|uniref:Uncharacterized protein n=1 Tax=Thelohanellus kitauei TaxID=669202 RepID=A0A0C2NC93_THEKT|nr:hypothetical protein RF11_05541 [Thelohanellus kitauei]
MSIDKKHELTCHQSEITSIKWVTKDNDDILFSVDINSLLYYHSYDNNIKGWSSKCIKLFSIPIQCMEIIQGEELYILVGGKDGSVILLNFSKKEVHKSYKLPYEISDIKTDLDKYAAFRFGNGQAMVIPLTTLL